MDLSVPDTVDNRYKVLEVIGTGAMATVYAAEDTRLGRKVALKILRPEQAQDDTFRARFKRDAEAVASLNNPAIVAVYDTGSFDPSQSYGVDEAAGESTLIPYRDGVRGGSHPAPSCRVAVTCRLAMRWATPSSCWARSSTATRWASFTAILSRRTSWCWTAPARISRRVSRARLRSWTSAFLARLRRPARR